MLTRRSLLLFLVMAISAGCAVTPPPNPSPTSGRATPIPALPGPAMLEVGGRQVAPSHQGGCPGVYHVGEWVTGDQCGPNPFDLDASSTRIAPAAELTFTAPAGWEFGAEAIEGAPQDAWTVMLARVAAIAVLPVHRHESIYLSGQDETLGVGQATTSTIDVFAPTKPGEYLLELRAYVTRDGWTWGPVLYHWRISIT